MAGPPPTVSLHRETTPSTTSATTVGGCTFEELCKGTVLSYACDYTVDVRESDFEQAKKKILKHIDDCIKGLEIERERKVEKLYIGKTYIPRKKHPEASYQLTPKIIGLTIKMVLSAAGGSTGTEIMEETA